MRFPTVLLTAAMLLLTACGGSDRPTYSGREESTAGVPGFSADGKRKLHPTVKLGQSYTVGGKTYVPKYQPEYDETGMASWYGPGFHGGKTANGESFSTHQYTAAHTTLPLPSIVKVTYLKTGRSTFVRINDRGPFAHGRIIDLSKAAAEDIGMIRDGVGKVRVQYMPQETERFVELMTSGRDPQSIDIASEVIGHAPNYSQATEISVPNDAIMVSDTMPVSAAPTATPSMWQHMNPVARAEAAEPIVPPVATGVIVAPTAAALPPQTVQASISPNQEPVASITPVTLPAELPPPGQPASVSPSPSKPAQANATGTTYVQVGAFSNRFNAEKLQQRVADIAATEISPAQVNGGSVYRVRMGPFVSDDAALEVMERAHGMGLNDAKLITR